MMTTTVQLLIPILTINIQDAVLRFSLDEECDEKEVIGEALKIIVISSVLLAVSLLIIGKNNILKMDAQYLYFLFLSFIFGLSIP